MKFKDYKRFCLVDTTYSLLLYLLHASEAEIKETFFIFQQGMPSEIRNFFPARKKFVQPRYKFGIINGVLWLLFQLRAMLFYRIPRDAVIFAHDHLFISYGLLYHRKYCLLEDCPGAFSANRELIHRYWDQKGTDILPPRFSFKKFFRGSYGNNEYCTGILAIRISGEDYIPPEKFIVADMEKCWRTMDESKRRFILKLFGITPEIVSSAQGRGAVLFTQPLIIDCRIREAELIEIYRKLLSGVKMTDLVIKPHPRDPVAYERYFPGALILRTLAPFQLLVALGMNFSTGITIFSSAVSVLPPDAKIVWGGSEIHPAIFKRYGHIYLSAFR